MTIIWIKDHTRTSVPTVGYLSSVARRSDRDCLNRRHVDDVLRARRDRENYANPSAGFTPGALPPRASDAAPEIPAASIIERLDSYWLDLSPREARFLTVVILLAVFCAAAIVVL